MVASEEGLMLKASSGGRTEGVKIGARDCAFLAEILGARSVPDRKEFPCFEDIGAVSRDD